MIRMAIRTLAIAVAIVAASVSALAGDEAPAWLKQAAAQAVPVYPEGTPAVVLVDESTITVADDGRTTAVARYAVRVLIREGREYCVVRVPYMPGSGKVRDFKAWHIRDGQTKAFGKGEVADVTGSVDDTFSEARVAAMSLSDEAESGSVVGFEYVQEDRPLLAQDEWSFQSRLPVISSRLTLVLPAGWQANGVVFNHEAVEPKVSGSTWVWEMRGLPPIPPESAAPPVTNLAPRLAYAYQSPSGSRAGLSFSSWPAVAQWSTTLVAPQAAPNDALASKAKELTSGSTTELDRIRAIGRYVQGLTYISIQTNLAKGGGYKPRAAVDVFARSYGDCKDKANLMLAMLRAIGIESYLMAIYSGDPTYVREEYPTPSQFNHCILAVRVGPSTQAPTVFDNPSVGRLLAFDPTDPYAPVGDLPDHLQGSFALLMAGDAGGLVRMPVTPPDANRLDRKTEAKLGLDGSISGSISERSTGSRAVEERALFEGLSRPDYDARVNRWIGAGVPGARVSRIAPSDDRLVNRFGLDVEFASDKYAQMMGGRLYVFKPALVSRLQRIELRSDELRTQPVVLESQAFGETARFELPAGMVVDEMPDPVKLETPFGVYTTTYEAKDGVLVFTRTLTLKRSTIPAANFESARAFFAKIRDAEQAPVVLVRR